LSNHRTRGVAPCCCLKGVALQAAAPANSHVCRDVARNVSTAPIRGGVCHAATAVPNEMTRSVPANAVQQSGGIPRAALCLAMTALFMAVFCPARAEAFAEQECTILDYN
jgi:hypothetical protein